MKKIVFSVLVLAVILLVTACSPQFAMSRESLDGGGGGGGGIFIDRIPPEIKYVSVLQHQGTTYVRLNATDNVGIGSYEYVLSHENTTGTYIWDHEVVTLSPAVRELSISKAYSLNRGDYRIDWTVWDGAKNQAYDYEEFTVS